MRTYNKSSGRARKNLFWVKFAIEKTYSSDIEI